ncbi:hypothetical protein AAF712_006926 [Marasmius tenuissimus]|uniref:Uncharacterized protein n=1 Tax=Marasmius tenuissimus TaxID=585030 RepID=A0ABR2ZXT3_9AGAR
MYSTTNTAPRRVKPLPKRRRTGSISTPAAPSNPPSIDLNHYGYPNAHASSTNGTHATAYHSLPSSLQSLQFPLPQNLASSLQSLPNLHSVPPLPLNLPPTPPIPSSLPISDELLNQWKNYCMPLLGSAADALLSAGGFGGQVYSGGRTGNGTASGVVNSANGASGSDGPTANPSPNGTANGGESNIPGITLPLPLSLNFPLPLNQATPQPTSQSIAQLESYISLASAAVAAQHGTPAANVPQLTSKPSQSRGSQNDGQTQQSSQTSPQSQLDPVAAAAYLQHLNATLRAAGLPGPFPPTPAATPRPKSNDTASAHRRPREAISRTSSTYPDRETDEEDSHSRVSVSVSVSEVDEEYDRDREYRDRERDYREDELDDRDDDRGNGRNNTKKRKVPGLTSRSGSGVIASGGQGGSLGAYGTTGSALVDGTAGVEDGDGGLGAGGGGKGEEMLEGNRVREIEYTGEMGRTHGYARAGKTPSGLRKRPAMSRVTMAGIQHKTRKRQLASVLLRGVGNGGIESTFNGDASTLDYSVPLSPARDSSKEVVKISHPTTTPASTEIALDQMLSDLTGLGLYSYPSLGSANNLNNPLKEKPKVKVRLSKRENVRKARNLKAQENQGPQGGAIGKSGGVGGKANKENLNQTTSSPSGKKKKKKGGAAAAARVEPVKGNAGGRDAGDGALEKGILVPKSKFTFMCRNATSDRLLSTKDEVKFLRGRFEAELSRQTAKLAGEAKAKAKANDIELDGRGAKKRIASGALGSNSPIPVTSSTVTTATPSMDDLSQPSTPSKNASKKKKKKRSALANASNPHHLRNYVPSRVPGVGVNNTQNANANDGNELGPPPTRFLNAQIRSGKNGKADSTASVDTASNVNNLTQPGEEWICAFCEYELFYGDDADFRKAVRKRKAILKRRKRAREKAADKASGEAGRRVRERQRELEKEQFNQAQTTQSQQPVADPDGDPESEAYDEDEYEEDDEGYEESVGQTATSGVAYG